MSNASSPPVGHGVSRVDGEIQHDLLELPGIADHDDGRGVPGPADDDVLLDRPLEQLDDFVDDQPARSTAVLSFFPLRAKPSSCCVKTAPRFGGLLHDVGGLLDAVDLCVQPASRGPCSPGSP